MNEATERGGSHEQRTEKKYVSINQSNQFICYESNQFLVVLVVVDAVAVIVVCA